LADYTLGLDAEIDLLEIGRYTARTWGLGQAASDLAALKKFRPSSKPQAMLRRQRKARMARQAFGRRSPV